MGVPTEVVAVGALVPLSRKRERRGPSRQAWEVRVCKPTLEKKKKTLTLTIIR